MLLRIVALRILFSTRPALSLLCPLLVIAGLSIGCEDSTEVSAAKAEQHATYLSQIAASDVKEIQVGLPQGAEHLTGLWKEGEDPREDPQRARDALQIARGKVQELRVAKSSFFAVATLDGTVIRNDLEQDMMAGKNLFSAFPALKGAASAGYRETVGSMAEARGVEGKPDGQWVAVHPVRQGGQPVGLYVTGWAWSTYATRLGHALRSQILDTEDGKLPLYYVFVVVDGKAYGAPEAPEVNAEAIEKLDPKQLLSGKQSVSRQLEITGRGFGLGLAPAPALGEQVSIAVLRSET